MSDLALGNEPVATRFMSVKSLILLAFRGVDRLGLGCAFLWNPVNDRDFR